MYFNNNSCDVMFIVREFDCNKSSDILKHYQFDAFNQIFDNVLYCMLPVTGVFVTVTH